MSLRAEFIRQRTEQARRPKLQNISAPAPIAPPPPSGTGAVPIRSKRLNYVAKKAGATSAKATVGKATGKTVVPKVPVTSALQEALDKVEIKDAVKKRARELDPLPTPPTTEQVVANKVQQKVGIKQGVADAETQRLRDKFSGGGGIPLVTPAINNVANKMMIDKGFGESAIYGTLGGFTLAPIAAGAAIYQNQKNKEAEKEKQGQAQEHRDKVAEVIAKRNLLLEQRQAAQPQSQARVPYNFFSAAPLSAPANFEIGFRNPFFVKPKKALPLATVAGGLIGTYGLLSKLNKQRALDAYKVNGLKDKNAQDFAANYFDSPQYHADNLIREAANITGNPLLQGITDNPLDKLTPAQKAEVQKKKGSMARYSRGAGKVANFFDPFITPMVGLGSAAYGIYNKKKAADEQSEVFEAQKLAALGSIKDKSLRQQLLAKAQGQVIDEDSKNRIIDSALNGDIKSVFRTGLKKVNWDALQ